MSPITLLYKRFISAMPKTLKKLALILGGISGAGFTCVTLFNQYQINSPLKDTLLTIAIATAGGAFFLNFTTSDPNLQDPPTPKP